MTVSKPILGKETVVLLVNQLMEMSVWFEVEPLSDDEYIVTVKDDIAPIAFKNII